MIRSGISSILNIASKKRAKKIRRSTDTMVKYTNDVDGANWKIYIKQQQNGEEELLFISKDNKNFTKYKLMNKLYIRQKK